MDPRSEGNAGLLGSLRRMAALFVATLANRFELFIVELQEEGRRSLRLLIWTAAAGVCALMALILLNFLVLAIFWESARLPAAAGLLLFHIGAALYGVRRARRLLRESAPFAATLEELKKDRACLEGKRPNS